MLYPALSIIASVGAFVVMRLLCIAAELDEHTTSAFLFWTGVPYLGYSLLALSRRDRPGASAVVFASTIISAGAASALYWADLSPSIGARARGEEVMNCGGPLVEFGFPLLQWISVVVLAVATSRRQATASTA
jgi:hypothetical protein